MNQQRNVDSVLIENYHSGYCIPNLWRSRHSQPSKPKMIRVQLNSSGTVSRASKERLPKGRTERVWTSRSAVILS